MEDLLLRGQNLNNVPKARERTKALQRHRGIAEPNMQIITLENLGSNLKVDPLWI